VEWAGFKGQLSQPKECADFQILATLFTPEFLEFPARSCLSLRVYDFILCTFTPEFTIAGMLTLSGMRKAYGERVLFADASLQVNREDRIGLVGPNGAGKTTLFSIILGEETSDEGKFSVERGVRIGYLPQENAPVADETVIELATAVTPEFTRLRRILKAWEADHPTEALHSEDIHDDVHDRFNELGGYRLEAKAKQILAGLSFREKDFERPAREMSGGWVMRAHLARLLTLEPDLLLLDEPTNHLDLEALLWFQGYLKTYPGAIVVISHDREFLNHLVGYIVEIRQSKLIRYRGNYDDIWNSARLMNNSSWRFIKTRNARLAASWNS